MLLTLTSSSVLPMLSAGRMTLFDLPDFAIKKLKLRGLNVLARSLAGWSAAELDRLRDRADKAACPCLVLVQNIPLALGDSDPEAREVALERVLRLASAANRLGCNAIAIRCDGADDDEVFEHTASQLKDAMQAVEQLELNLLLAPHEGLTWKPDRLTDLIKRIGGFRIGSLPSFEHAHISGDLVGVLRKLAPYAGAVHASVRSFDGKGKHEAYDLAECVEAIRSVGFTNTLAIDYIGSDDPTPAIERARDILNEAIETVVQ